MNRNVFEQYRQLIYEVSGIALNEQKESLLESRLSKRLRKFNCDHASYLELVKHDPAECNELIDAVSTNVTHFFRDAVHFEVLSQLLKDRTDRKPLRIWCAACSTGEEPYSLAITCLEKLGPRARVKILATDINSTVLAQAQQGIYSADAVQNLDRNLLTKYFAPGKDRAEGYFRVKDSVRSMIRFGRLNLIHQPYPLPLGIDIVFCRNVMIYFDAPTRREVMKAMHRVLAPHGHLFTALSESLQAYAEFFETISPSVGRKVDR